MGKEAVTRPRNSVLLLILFAVVIGLGVGSAYAKIENFTVPPGSEVTRSLSLHENDRVSIGFSVVGESADELTFYVTDPYGDIILHHERVGQKSLSFLAEITGTYVLHFDNSHSSESKMVTLNYDIEHLIMGMPQAMFLVLIIVGVLIAAIATFTMMGKP